MSITTLTTYAAHDDMAIYALGGTPDAAIKRAREDAKDDSAEFDVHEIEREFAADIEAHGFDGKHDSFEIIDGVIQAPSDD